MQAGRVERQRPDPHQHVAHVDRFVCWFPFASQHGVPPENITVHPKWVASSLISLEMQPRKGRASLPIEWIGQKSSNVVLATKVVIPTGSRLGTRGVRCTPPTKISRALATHPASLPVSLTWVDTKGARSAA